MPVIDADRLEARLREVMSERSLLKHELYQGWAQGTLPRERLHEYVRQYYHFEVQFPRFLSAIHARSDCPEVRQTLVANLWDEEYGDRNHPVLWLELGEALGVPAAEVRAGRPNPETAALIAHFHAVASTAPVAEALAALFAFEAQMPAAANEKVRGLATHYGLTLAQCEFFTVHQESDVYHSTSEMAAIALVADDEEPVVRATREACDRLLAFLDGCGARVGV